MWQTNLHCIIVYLAWSAYFSSLWHDQNIAQPGCKTKHDKERRNVRLKISTCFGIAINFHEDKNRDSWCHHVSLPLIMLDTISPHDLQALGKQGVLTESKKKCPNKFHYKRSTAIFAHSVETTNFFQKMALIYGSHVTIKREIIFISVLDSLVSARVSILLLTIWNRDRWFIIHNALETCLNLKMLPAFLRKELFPPCFDKLLLTMQYRNF